MPGIPRNLEAGASPAANLGCEPRHPRRLPRRSAKRGGGHDVGFSLRGLRLLTARCVRRHQRPVRVGRDRIPQNLQELLVAAGLSVDRHVLRDV